MGVRFPPGAPRLQACHDAGTVIRDDTGMKRCGRCGKTKSVESFGFRNRASEKRHSVCKTCQAVYRTAYNARHGPELIHARVHAHTLRYRRRNREFIGAYLSSHPCVDCGLADPVVLEFDHVTGSKRAALSVLVRSAATIATLNAEIAKCVVRCANCHRRRTALSWRKGSLLSVQGFKGQTTELRRSPPRGDCSSVG